MDFVHDQLGTGTKPRVLTIVDTFSSFSPAIEPRFTFRGADVVEVLGKSRAGDGIARQSSVSTKARSSCRATGIHGRTGVDL
jgi:hypothetical protein